MFFHKPSQYKNNYALFIALHSNYITITCHNDNISLKIRKIIDIFNDYQSLSNTFYILETNRTIRMTTIPTEKAPIIETIYVYCSLIEHC